MSIRFQRREDALKVRPNTGVPQEFIQDNMVICSGEDRDELMHAVTSVTSARIQAHHHYRCYDFWRFSGFTLVLGGIGTGSLEPLMWELLDRKTLGDKVAKRLTLIGTAGYLADSGFGQVYLVEGAIPVGCGVSVTDPSELPLRAHFAATDSLHIAHAEEISTDHYYSCSPRDDARINEAKRLNGLLADGVQDVWKPGRLISMESAQFYFFAHCYGDDNTQYAAFRGVANLADQFDTQGDYAVTVLAQAFEYALDTLGVNHQTLRLAA